MMNKCTEKQRPAAVRSRNFHCILLLEETNCLPDIKYHETSSCVSPVAFPSTGSLLAANTLRLTNILQCLDLNVISSLLF